MGEKPSGDVKMIDVGPKEDTERVATASGRIHMKAGTLACLVDGNLPKGDALGAARVAGIMAAKKTWETIPLCHPIRLTSVDLSMRVDRDMPGVEARGVVRARDRTGVEMEALTAVSVGLLTLYDMLKGIDMGMEIGEIHLDSKKGGRSGYYSRMDSGVHDKEKERA